MKKITINLPIVMKRDKYYWFKVGKVNLNISFVFIQIISDSDRQHIFLAPNWWVERMRKEGKIEHFKMIVEDV